MGTLCPLGHDVDGGGNPEWSSVISACPPSLQEPELDPKPILELPLEKLVQKLLADELSLESVLCSYLEEVRSWSKPNLGALGGIVGGQM